VLPGVIVTITSLQGSKAVHTVVTDRSGRFVEDLPPGAYSVKAVLAGFEPATMAEVGVRANQETPVSLTMGLPLLTEQVVVTGTPRAQGVSKLDASFAITTIPESKIDDVAPLSSADLLKVSPGIWVESSGGKSGANVFFRGFPTTGDAPFLTMQYDGSPLYGDSTLSFLEQTTLFRLDETIDRVEVLRGGPNAVFSNGQAGVTANVIPKIGGNRTRGLVKASTSSYGLARGDAFLSGPLGDRWYYSAGAFLRTSNGIRDPQFPADQGGQLSVNLSHAVDTGNLTFYGRRTNDKNLWMLPVPILNANGNFEDVPGFPAGTGTYAGDDTRNVDLEVNPGGGTVHRDLADGRGPNYWLTGGNFDMTFGEGWTLSARGS
jgi:outer membrane receptor protein involved in Fe transport